jgi:3-hydroxybutyryl-CoA dehydratase
MEKEYYEDYVPGEIFVSPGRTITETDLVLFSGITGDWHVMHTNVEYARESSFGQRIAHGMLILSIGTALLFRLGDNVLFPKSFIAFYGIDKLRFVKPVLIGDTISCQAEVIEMQEKDANRGVITYDTRIRNQRNEMVVLMIQRIIAGRRP